MAQRVILFTGAPSASSVNNESCTVGDFSSDFNALLGRTAEEGIEAPASGFSHAAWRSIPLTRQPLHSGFSQVHEDVDSSIWGHGNFFAIADASLLGDGSTSFDGLGEDQDALLTQFCEHSLAVHNNSTASAGLNSFGSAVSDETSFMTTGSGENTTADLSVEVSVPLHLSDLEDIPPARQVLALVPQTISLNLIVAIISIAQPRTVTTRWGRTTSLVEILVADDTASGFAVTFWLNAKASPASITRLRRQDVVLMQNVALNVFRGKVYGQSLRGALTRVDLLWRADGSGSYSSRALSNVGAASHPQRIKTAKVREWVLQFVGVDSRSRTKGKEVKKKSWDVPPDDTPEIR